MPRCDSGGDCECLCTAVATYAEECSQRGISVRWRSQELCRKSVLLMHMVGAAQKGEERVAVHGLYGAFPFLSPKSLCSQEHFRWILMPLGELP